MANDDVQQWNNIDRIGLYTKKDEGQIVRNIWKEYTQEEAIELLNHLPNTLRSPAYRDTIKRVLLSEAKPTKDEITSPALLAKRIDLLIQYGLFTDAQALYDLAVEQNTLSTDYDLALIGLKLSMLNGDIAPICLDVEAFSTQFRDMPAWREISTFCKLRFGSSKKTKASKTNFTHFPVLKKILTHENLKFSDASNTWNALTLYSDNKISEKHYNQSARELSELSDLNIALGTKSRFKSRETYQCYMIEAAKRGIHDIDVLKDSYISAKFSENDLTNDGGDIRLHPCDITAFFYQKLQQDITEEDKDILAAAMLDVSKEIPDIALSPMAEYLNNVQTPLHKWRATQIKAFAHDTIPESYLPTSKPLLSWLDTNQISKKDYIEWYNTDNHSDLFKTKSIDPASILYISRILSGDLNHLKSKTTKKDYGKLFSLTYDKKSLGLGLGFSDYIASYNSDDDHAAALIMLIAKTGEYAPKDIHLNDLAVILSALKAYKLEKNAITLSFEYLQ